MTARLQLRRGTTAEMDAFTGAEGEPTFDVDKGTVVVHDGVTLGGIPLARGDSQEIDITTDDVSEGTSNLYYTDTRARDALSAAGDLSYDSATGEFSFTERTDSEIRGLFSASGDLSYNSATGVFSFTETSGSGSVSTYSDLTLKDVSQYTDGDIFYVGGRSSVGDGGEGHFRWDSSNLSTEVGNDEVTSGDGDGGIYVAPDSDKSGASGAWVRQFTGRISVQMYGAKGDGVTDDAPAVQSAIDSGYPVWFPKTESEYLLESEITVYSGTDLLLHDTAIIRTADNVNKGFVGSGSEGPDVSLTSDAAEGNAIVNVGDTSSFSVGDYVLISDDRKHASNAPKQGEIHKIEQIFTGTSFRIEHRLWSAYETAQNAIARRIDFADHLRIQGGIFRGGGSSAQQNAAMKFNKFNDVIIDGVRVDEWFSAGISLQNVINGSISRCRIENIVDTSQGYATLMEEATQWVTVERCTTKNVGRLFDLGGPSTGRGTIRFVNVDRNADYQPNRNTSISTHEGGQFIDVTNNKISVRLDGSDGIFFRGSRCRAAFNIIDVFAQNANAGIFCRNSGGKGYFIIEGNIIRKMAGGGDQRGILIQNFDGDVNGSEFNEAIEKIVVRDNIVEEVGGAAIEIHNRMSTGITEVNIQGNQVFSSGEHGIWIRADDGSVNRLAITGNLVSSPSVHTGIVLDAGSGNLIQRFIISGNQVQAGDFAVAATGSGTVQSGYVTANVLSGGNGTTINFDPNDIGDNRSV